MDKVDLPTLERKGRRQILEVASRPKPDLCPLHVFEPDAIARNQIDATVTEDDWRPTGFPESFVLFATRHGAMVVVEGHALQAMLELIRGELLGGFLTDPDLAASGWVNTPV